MVLPPQSLLGWERESGCLSGFSVQLCGPESVPGPHLPTQAKTKGNKVNVGVKYAEKQERKFEPEKLREGRNIIGLQVWSFPRLGLADELWLRRAPWSLQALAGWRVGRGWVQDMWPLGNPMLSLFGTLTHSSDSPRGWVYCYHHTLYTDGKTEAWRFAHLLGLLR